MVTNLNIIQSLNGKINSLKKSTRMIRLEEEEEREEEESSASSS